MKFVINIIALLVLTIQFSFAQDLNVEKVKNDWEEIKNKFLNELQKDTKNFRSELFTKPNGGGDEPLKPVIDYFNKLKFNGKDFSNFKTIKFGPSFELQGEQKASYNRIAESYIKKLKNEYKSSSIVADKKGDEQKNKKESTEDVLKKNVDSLQKQIDELNKKLQAVVNDTAVILNDTISKLQEELKNNKQNNQSKGFFCYLLENWILALIAILEFVFIILIFKRCNRALNKNEDLRDKISELKKQKQSSETQLRSLQNQKPKEIIKEKEIVKTVYVDRPAPEREEKKIIYKYLSQLNSADGGYFKLVQDEYDSSCFYRMFNINDGTAKYEFYGDELRAIKKWSSILDSAAEYEGDTDSAKHIKNIVPGVIQYDSSAECWKIVKKAKLKLY